MKTVKYTAKTILWVSIGALYFPIYLIMWLLRIIARILLAIAYFGTFEYRMAAEVFLSVFSRDYERHF